MAQAELAEVVYLALYNDGSGVWGCGSTPAAARARAQLFHNELLEKYGSDEDKALGQQDWADGLVVVQLAYPPGQLDLVRESLAENPDWPGVETLPTRGR